MAISEETSTAIVQGCVILIGGILSLSAIQLMDAKRKLIQAEMEKARTETDWTKACHERDAADWKWENDRKIREKEREKEIEAELN